MSVAVAVVEPWIPRPESHREWPQLSTGAPQLVATMRRYLLQLTTFLAPRSVDAADQTLRQFARWLVATTDVAVVADITRTHIEDYKVWLAAQPGTKSPTLARALLDAGLGALGRPPDDLATVLAEVALGGPAVCAARAISAVTSLTLESERVLWAAAWIASSFRSYFNASEVTGIIVGRGGMLTSPISPRGTGRT